MKLDMDEIRTLTPPGLHNLRPMLRVVEILTALITKQVPGSAAMLKLVRAVGRYAKQARDNANHNLNMQIRAWVLAQPERRLWVRRIIGEAAIRRWEKRYANLPHPSRPPVQTMQRAKPIAAAKFANRPYAWKQFALVNLSFLELQPFDLRSPALINTGNWSQPRAPRGVKPPAFWGFELAPDYRPPATHLHREIPRVKIAGKPNDKPPPNPHPPPQKGTNQKSQNKPPPKPKERPP